MSGAAPGRREVAYRLFAAEFQDAEFSYSESDEERAPNYVVTPTGARVNRLFAVGVLTEVDDVNPEMVRGRVVDPTGAFVTYAGQYQPDALAFLERADTPSFVALSGKARTFEPDDDDVVYSSVRPESINDVAAETRDRWVLTAAERTLERIGIVAAAIDADLAGDQLRAALQEDGVDEGLADGVALALDYYHTTPAYLGALRETAREAVQVVAGDRDEVGGLTVQPGDAGGTGAASATELATLDLADAPSPATAAAAADAGGSSGPQGSTDDGALEDAEPPADPGAESGTATGDESPAASDSIRPAAADETPAAGSDDEPDSEPEVADGDQEPAADVEEGDPGAFDLDEETRREVEEEYGTEFSRADEVEEADSETLQPGTQGEGQPDTEAGAPERQEPAAGEPAAADATAESTESAGSGGDGTDRPEAEAADADAEGSAAEVDLEDAVMETMEAVGDDEGADREELVAAVVEEHGVDREAVESAIQDALMSGRCYEPSEGTLKAI